MSKSEIKMETLESLLDDILDDIQYECGYNSGVYKFLQKKKEKLINQYKLVKIAENDIVEE